MYLFDPDALPVPTPLSILHYFYIITFLALCQLPQLNFGSIKKFRRTGIFVQRPPNLKRFRFGGKKLENSYKKYK